MVVEDADGASCSVPCPCSPRRCRTAVEAPARDRRTGRGGRDPLTKTWGWIIKGWKSGPKFGKGILAVGGWIIGVSHQRISEFHPAGSRETRPRASGVCFIRRKKRLQKLLRVQRRRHGVKKMENQGAIRQRAPFENAMKPLANENSVKSRWRPETVGHHQWR